MASAIRVTARTVHNAVRASVTANRGVRAAWRAANAINTVGPVGGVQTIQARCFRLAATPLMEVVQFHLSDIGEGIKEVTVKEWFVKPGDKVAQFDQICEVQSDKASVTITSRFDGVVKKLYYAVDDIAQTGDPLVDIEVQGSGAGDNARVDVPDAEAIHIGTERAASGTCAVAEGGVRALATPAVRRLATEHNLDLSQVQGTGKEGRVMKEDVLNHLESLKSGSKPTPPAAAKAAATAPGLKPKPPTPTPAAPVRRPGLASLDTQREESFSPMTKGMTKTMTEALKIPQFGYFDEVDMTKMVALRRELKDRAEREGVKLSFMPFMVKAASIALSAYPILNSSIDVDREKIIYKASHNIGVAMDSPFGLIVPNIKKVQELGIFDIAREISRLYDLSQKGKLSSDDLKGGTFTLSNIGTIGGTYAFPVIMPPEVAIAALGKLQAVPRFGPKGEVVRADVLNVSWSADHRVIDGATIARFSNTWKGLLEEPTTFMLEMK